MQRTVSQDRDQMSTENENITVDVPVENRNDCVDLDVLEVDVGCVEVEAIIWGVARASTIVFKDKAWAQVRKLSPGTASDLERSNIEGWCRAFSN